MVLYVIYKDAKVLKEELKLPEQMAVAAKLGEIVVDSQALSEETTIKGDQKKVKDENTSGVETSPV